MDRSTDQKRPRKTAPRTEELHTELHSVAKFNERKKKKERIRTLREKTKLATTSSDESKGDEGKREQR